MLRKARSKEKYGFHRMLKVTQEYDHKSRRLKEKSVLKQMPRDILTSGNKNRSHSGADSRQRMHSVKLRRGPRSGGSSRIGYTKLPLTMNLVNLLLLVI